MLLALPRLQTAAQTFLNHSGQLREAHSQLEALQAQERYLKEAGEDPHHGVTSLELRLERGREGVGGQLSLCEIKG